VTPARVTVVEVGPRDGLQNEAAIVPTATKVRFIEMLAAAGLPVVEATSFVHPAAVPQLADADQVLPAIARRPGVRYPVLVPNMRGMERAVAAGADAIAVFTAASEAFAQANMQQSLNKKAVDVSMVTENKQISEDFTRYFGISSTRPGDLEDSNIQDNQYLFVGKSRKSPGKLIPMRRDFGFQRYVDGHTKNKK